MVPRFNPIFTIQLIVAATALLLSLKVLAYDADDFVRDHKVCSNETVGKTCLKVAIAVASGKFDHRIEFRSGKKNLGSVFTYASNACNANYDDYDSSSQSLKNLSCRLGGKLREAIRLESQISDCDQGDQEACTKVAISYLRSDVVDRNLEYAIPTLIKACNSGITSACPHAAQVFLGSYGDAWIDVKKAIKVYQENCSEEQRGCDASMSLRLLMTKLEFCQNGEEPEACLMASAKLAEKDDFNEVPIDLEFSMELKAMALEQLDTPCKAGVVEACEGMFRYYSRPPEENSGEAKRIGMELCSAGSLWICRALLKLDLNQSQRPVVIQNLIRLSEKDCFEHKEGRGCFSLAKFLESLQSKLGNQRDHFYIWKNDCNKNKNQRSCEALGLRYRFGIGIERNQRLAKKYYDKACKISDYSSGCSLAQNDWKVDESRWKACESGQMPGQCWLMGYFAHGRGSTNPVSKFVIDTWTKGCDMGDSSSCDSLADAYFGRSNSEFEGVTKDLDLSISLRKQACARGEGLACDRVSDRYDPIENLTFGDPIYDGVPKDINLAMEYARKGCALAAKEHGFSIERLKTVEDLSLFKFPPGTAFPWERGVCTKHIYHQTALKSREGCEVNREGMCLEYADVLASGLYPHYAEQDVAAAEQIYGGLCDQGEPKACERIGRFFDGCMLGSESACRDYIDNYRPLSNIHLRDETSGH